MPGRAFSEFNYLELTSSFAEACERADAKRDQRVGGATATPFNNEWWRAELINARGLCDQRFPDVRYVVPGLFPEGVTLLASRPKVGKSWLLLQITTAVANGTVTLVASNQPPIGDVLYLALEDNRRRLQRRLTKYFGANKDNWPERLAISIKWKRLDQGGLEAIRAWCKSVAKPTLIAIDTLKKVRAPKRQGQTDYDADYEACQGLQELAGEFGVAVIVAHHDRKMDAEDVFDTVSGTLGLTGGVDTIAIIKRRVSGTTLHIEGRDLVEMIEKAISFDRETCRWAILGEAAEVQRSDQRGRVLAALANAKDGMSPSDLSAELGISHTNAKVILFRMERAGEIQKLRYGRYSCNPCNSCNSSENKKALNEIAGDSDRVTAATGADVESAAVAPVSDVLLAPAAQWPDPDGYSFHLDDEKD